ncbi:alpha/beta fold hydrolase [Roseibium sp. SCP14]|uniref:alpha/beta fold hydrolase n=1 Tax=Roseibium sp. SCP14 TaxID=3141375 RepID=UPI00333ADA4A
MTGWLHVTPPNSIALLFLHALPLDGTMWRHQQGLFPVPAYTPTLYGSGDSIEAWAETALDLVEEDRLILVGCSVGGSCALEIAALSPDRVEAMILIGTKAVRTPNPAFLSSALTLIETQGAEAAWETYWQPLFSEHAPESALATAKDIFSRRTDAELSSGTKVFHTRSSRNTVLQTFPRGIAVISGAEDIAPGPATSEEQAHAAPQGTFHVIPDCGHYAPLEAPDQVNDILRQAVLPILSPDPDGLDAG